VTLKQQNSKAVSTMRHIELVRMLVYMAPIKTSEDCLKIMPHDDDYEFLR